MFDGSYSRPGNFGIVPVQVDPSMFSQWGGKEFVLGQDNIARVRELDARAGPFFDSLALPTVLLCLKHMRVFHSHYAYSICV